MSEEKSSQGGASSQTGAITLVLNPPPAAQTGVDFDESWVRAELTTDGLKVQVFAQVKYAGRTSVSSIDISDDPGIAPLKGALEQVLAAYGDSAKGQALTHGFAARAFAQGQGEL